MILTDTTWIDAAPQRVFRFLQAMYENYTRWHPDHLAFHWIDGDGLVEGGRFRMEERQVRALYDVPSRPRVRTIRTDRTDDQATVRRRPGGFT